MGNISFLTGASGNAPQSVSESIYQLENCSLLFLGAWQNQPQDLPRASRASKEAMVHLDHIVNEILRVRDQLKADNAYSGSALESQLNIDRGLAASPVTRAQQLALPLSGAGNGSLPTTGSPITMERLLNKIKHRRPDSTNFRINNLNKHIFIVGVDRPNQSPDSIVEFLVIDFCRHCSAIEPLL